ncbi:MAG: zinc ribbon domain-containing protein [Chloroflexi bacterium]|nr:zinc ribbon domain-containing protein [Chloroflexota bacterium]
MAIYEYYCPTCRETFELRRPMSEATAGAMCECGAPAERTISNFAIAVVGGDSAVAQMEPEFGASGGCACGGGGCGCSS